MSSECRSTRGNSVSSSQYAWVAQISEEIGGASAYSCTEARSANLFRNVYVQSEMARNSGESEARTGCIGSAIVGCARVQTQIDTSFENDSEMERWLCVLLLYY